VEEEPFKHTNTAFSQNLFSAINNRINTERGLSIATALGDEKTLAAREILSTGDTGGDNPL